MCCSFVLPTFAAPTVILDGQQLSFDVPPTIEDSRTLVPLRAIFEAMGAAVDWDQETRTAIGHKGDTTVLLPIGSVTPTINGNTYALDVPGKIVDGRTLAPLRFIGEAFGGTVGWDGATQTITITSADGTVIIPVSSEDIYVHYIDVGQADSIYIELPDDNDILIDAGNRADGPQVVDYLQDQGVDDIELLIATHPHEDHIGGLVDVIDSFVIEEIMVSGGTSTSQIYKDVGYAAVHEGSPIVEDNYQTYTWGDTTLDILTGNQVWDDANDYSVVCRLDTGDIEFLFTGDAETPVENILTGTLEAEILKVGHHGSTSSSSLAFLNRVYPEVAIICCGTGNTYGHPHQETLDKLQNIEANIYRTDLNGNIIVYTDGTKYTVTCVDNLQAQAAVSSITQPSGTASELMPDPSDTSDWVAITDIDLQGEVVTIKNNSTWSVDMTGWYLVSEEGNQTYYFPDNFSLAAGGNVYITSGKGAVDQSPSYLKWTGSYIWNNDGDPGQLYNSQGQLVAQWA